MNLLGRYAIPTDVFVDRLAMFLIVTQGIEDLGQCEVRETSDDFFRGDAELPELGDCAQWGAATRYDGGSVENLLGADNVWMACRGCHDQSLLESWGEVNFAPFLCCFDACAFKSKEKWAVPLHQPSRVIIGRETQSCRNKGAWSRFLNAQPCPPSTASPCVDHGVISRYHCASICLTKEGIWPRFLSGSSIARSSIA